MEALIRPIAIQNIGQMYQFETFDNIQIGDVCGQGTNSVVYNAHHIVRGGLFAVKITKIKSACLSPVKK